MTRRGLLVALFTERVPTDDGELNRFAERYNAYVSRLRAGIVDIALWRRVRNEWKRINGF